MYEYADDLIAVRFYCIHYKIYCKADSVNKAILIGGRLENILTLQILFK